MVRLAPGRRSPETRTGLSVAARPSPREGVVGVGPDRKSVSPSASPQISEPCGSAGQPAIRPAGQWGSQSSRPRGPPFPRPRSRDGSRPIRARKGPRLAPRPVPHSKHGRNRPAGTSRAGPVDHPDGRPAPHHPGAKPSQPRAPPAPRREAGRKVVPSGRANVHASPSDPHSTRSVDRNRPARSAGATQHGATGRGLCWPRRLRARPDRPTQIARPARPPNPRTARTA